MFTALYEPLLASDFLPLFVVEGTALPVLAPAMAAWCLIYRECVRLQLIPRRAVRDSPEAVCWDRWILQRKKLDWSFHPAWFPIPAQVDWFWAEEPAGSPGDSDCPAITWKDSLW